MYFLLLNEFWFFFFKHLKESKCYIHIAGQFRLYSLVILKGWKNQPKKNKIAFRIQNTPDSLPQGRPVLLDFEKVFNDIFNDYERNKTKKDSDLVAAKKVVDDFIETIKSYFKEKSFQKKEKDKVLGLTLGTDYSSMVYSKY